MAEFVEVMKQRKRMCNEELCNMCHLQIIAVKNGENCDTMLIRRSKEAEKIIMDWATEHPIVTNADKFKEVFGFEPSVKYCPLEDIEGCQQNCLECMEFDFWEQEWKDPKEKADE